MRTDITSAPRVAPALITLSLAAPMLLASLGVSIANIALPAMIESFSASLSQVQWVVLAYLLATTVVIVPAGYLGDRFGRRRVLLAGIGLFTLASLACAFAPTLAFLVVARAVQGAGAAMLAAMTMSLVRDVSTAGSLGASMGLLGSVSAIGTALGPFLGGMLVSRFGWPSSFMVLVMMGAGSFLLALAVLPGEPAGRGAGQRPFDLKGMVLLATTLLVFALALSARTGTSGPVRLALAVTAIAAAMAFVRVERNAASPLIRMSAFRNPTFSANLASNALVSSLMMTTLVVGPFYLISGLGLDGTRAGLVMAVGPLVSMLSGLPAGRLTDRFGPRKMVLAGLALALLGALSLALLPAWFGLTGYVAALVILTPGYQLFLAANNVVVMADAAVEERGVVSGILNLSRNLGLITGASAMSAVFSAALGAGDAGTAPSVAITQATSFTFGAASAITALALVIAAAGQRTRQLG